MLGQIYNNNSISTCLSISCHVGELIEQKILNEQQFNQHIGKYDKE